MILQINHVECTLRMYSNSTWCIITSCCLLKSTLALQWMDSTSYSTPVYIYVTKFWLIKPLLDIFSYNINLTISTCPLYLHDLRVCDTRGFCGLQIMLYDVIENPRFGFFLLTLNFSIIIVFILENPFGANTGTHKGKPLSKLEEILIDK